MEQKELLGTKLFSLEGKVALVTGAGRAFCAGGDLLEFEAALRQDGGRPLLETMAYNQGVLQRVEDLPVPVIGVANGVAVAGGLELLLCCDILLAAAGAKLGDGHTRYAIVPAGGATVRLLERLSPSQAAQLFYTTDNKGTGLGLYISRELCESNQARLDYKPREGGGSCFRITFAHPRKLS